MTKYYTFLLSALFCFSALTVQAQRPSPDQIPTDNGALTVQPIQHGTLVLSWNGTTIYADPFGGAAVFEGLESPDLILITDIHGDHLNLETLNALDTEGARLVVPQAVADRLPEAYSDKTVVIGNGETTEQMGIFIRPSRCTTCRKPRTRAIPRDGVTATY